MKQQDVVKYKEKYNKEHGIIPQTIKKEIREAIHGQENVDEAILLKRVRKRRRKIKKHLLKNLKTNERSIYENLILKKSNGT